MIEGNVIREKVRDNFQGERELAGKIVEALSIKALFIILVLIFQPNLKLIILNR